MAHTTRAVTFGNSALAEVLFSSYTAGQGGEQFTLAEFGLTGSLVSFWTVLTGDPDGIGRPGDRFRYMGAGKVLMYASGSTVEQPTGAISLTVFVFVQGS